MRRGLMGAIAAVTALVGVMIAAPASAADDQSIYWSAVASRPDGWATAGSRTPLRNEWNATPAASGQMRVGAGDNGGQTETLIDVPIPDVLAGAVVHTAALNLTVTGSSPCPAAAITAYAPIGTLTSHNATWAHWSTQRLGPMLDREAGIQCPFPATRPTRMASPTSPGGYGPPTSCRPAPGRRSAALPSTRNGRAHRR